MSRPPIAVLIIVLLAGGGACAPVVAPAPPDGSAVPTMIIPAARPEVAAPTVRWPPVNGRFDYQLGGAYRPGPSVRIVSRDRGAKAVPGTYSICYVNAFQTQPEESAFWTGRHPDLLLRSKGRPVEDADWPGEFLLDTSTAAKRTRLAAIVGGWIDGCRRSGFAAIEPDNLDSWTRSRGGLSRADNLAYAGLLAARAHRAGLAFAQKNTAELTRAERQRVGFDLAIAEECQVYRECGAYTTAYGRHVIEIEYADQPRRHYRAACKARGKKISIIRRDRDVVPRGQRGYRYQAC